MNWRRRSGWILVVLGGHAFVGALVLAMLGQAHYGFVWPLMIVAVGAWLVRRANKAEAGELH